MFKSYVSCSRFCNFVRHFAIFLTMIPHFKPRFFLFPSWLSDTFSSIFDNSHHWIKILREHLHISRHWAAESKIVEKLPNVKNQDGEVVFFHEKLWKEWTYFTIQYVWRVLPLNFVHCFQRQTHIHFIYETFSYFVFGTVLVGWNRMHIFGIDNFSIIPISIFADNLKKCRYIGNQ